MQTVRVKDNVGPTWGVPRTARGVLEDPNGVARIFDAGTSIATLEGPWSCTRFNEEKYGELSFSWLCWSITRARLNHRSALLRLHGVSLQDLFPFLVLGADPAPAYEPLPGVCNLRLVQLLDDVDLGHEELFRLLFKQAKACSPGSF